MAATATDGWAVTYRGSMVAEEYLDHMRADSRHLLFSVSKSLVGAVVGALHGAGAIELEAPVTAFVPELAQCGYAGATVRHLLDMRSGIAFSEDYSDPAAEIHLLDQAMGWAPKSHPDNPSTLREFLLTLRQKSAHGGPFEYRSCETDVLGWICEAATGQRMPELMSELLWSRIGAQCDATIGVDPAGTGFFDGGINACLTDMIRFGSLFLRDGVSLTEQQVVPAAWIADTLDGGPDSRQAFASSPDHDADLPGGMYRNQVWLPYPGNNVVLCLGMCGQMIYVNRAAEMVAAKVSAQPHSARAAHVGHVARIRCGGARNGRNRWVAAEVKCVCAGIFDTSSVPRSDDGYLVSTTNTSVFARLRMARGTEPIKRPTTEFNPTLPTTMRSTPALSASFSSASTGAPSIAFSSTSGAPACLALAAASRNIA